MKRGVILLFLLLGILPMSSCNILTPLAFVFAPDPVVEAVYLLEDRPTVVFIDDRQNLVTPTSMRRVLAEKIGLDLMVNEVLTMTINPQDAAVIARSRDSDDKLLSIGEIGKAVGAEQVIYVQVLDFRDRTDRFQPQPQAVCHIRVIDITNHERLFPDPGTNESAYPVQVVLQDISAEALRSRASRNQVSRLLAERLGEETAKLFYEYSASKIGTNLEGG